MAPLQASIIVGLDFGTHASGFAYSVDGGKTVKEFTNYPDQPTPYPKMLTALLYEDAHPIAFGWSAQHRYQRLSPQQKRSGAFVYVDRVKLALYEDKAISEYQVPAGLSPVQVISDYLEFMFEFISSHLRTALGSYFHPDKVRWCLTVPAMWSDAAKDKMRNAAHRAGMIDSPSSDALLITLEPEAAALYARHAEGGPISMTDGETFMVVDAGGGTVDITVHEVVRGSSGELALSEAASGTGALCGATYVDQAFLKHYREQVGPASYDSWLKAKPSDKLQLLGSWEMEKRLYDPLNGSEVAAAVAIPLGLHSKISESRKSMIRSMQDGEDECVLFSSSTMASLFLPIMREVVALVQQQLRKMPAGKRCNTLLLVGGFAASPALVQHVRGELEGRGVGNVVVPTHASAAVVKGAVLFGAGPAIIHSRRCRLTYGFNTARRAEAGDPARHHFIHETDKELYTRNVFKKLVEAGQLVCEGDVQEVTGYQALYNHQTSVPIDFFSMPSKHARFTDQPGMRRLGSVVVDLSRQVAKGIKPRDIPITVRLQFGSTEIKASAINTLTGKQVIATIEYHY